MRLGINGGEVPHDIVDVVCMGILEDMAELAPLPWEISQQHIVVEADVVGDDQARAAEELQNVVRHRFQ